MISEEIFDKNNVPALVIDEGNALEGIQKLIDIIKASDEFKRLADCTQIVFNDNKKNANMVQNRQSHTLFVAEISRRVAQKLGLTEEECKMAELIGLCHDLGHVAFGHDGENRIDEALKHFGITSQEYNDAYFANNGINNGRSKRVAEMKHAFEHHAQSTRVLRKILKDNNVVIKDQEILDVLELGILAHSESRAKKMKIPYKVSAITRYADKFYIFTDVLDIIKATEDVIALDTIKKVLEDSKILDKEFDNKEEMITFVMQVFTNFVQFQDGAIEEYKEQYIEDCELSNEEDTGWRVTAKPYMAKYLKVLKDLVKAMRTNDTIGKEEELADAMIDEVILYKAEHAEKDKEGNFVKSEKERIIDACLFAGEMEDTQLRNFYKVICKDEEWTKNYHSLATRIRSQRENAEFPIILAEDNLEILRKRTDIILTHYFKTEINKVQDIEIRKELFKLYTRYKSTMLRKDKKALIEALEQSNGNPRPSGPDR